MSHKPKTYRGLPKKKSPQQKWVAWFMMDINKENVNRSYVFVLAQLPLTSMYVQAIIATHSELLE